MQQTYDPITYRHPRTLEEAFGPYERWGEIALPDDDYPELTSLDTLFTYCAVFMLALLIITAITGLFQ